MMRCPRREVAATPDLFRPDRRIAARAAGRRNDRHIARLRRRCANFRVNSCGRAERAVGSRQFVAERLRWGGGGRGALRRDGTLLRHRLRRRATRRIPRGRWRGHLSRWRRWRRRSLRGCRAGCHQSCQDQKKRLCFHGEQMLPRYCCSLRAEKPTGVFGLSALRIRPHQSADRTRTQTVLENASSQPSLSQRRLRSSSSVIVMRCMVFPEISHSS